MNTSAAGLPLEQVRADAAGSGVAGIDYQRFLDCIHCGLCTSACPTYLELGTEADSPRGRIYLMRGVRDGRWPLDASVRRHLELCLDCRGCESACPSGVQYGRLIEPFRAELEMSAPPGSRVQRWFRWLLRQVFPSSRLLQRLLLPAWLVQETGMDGCLETLGFWRLLPEPLRTMHALLPRRPPMHRPLPPRLPPFGRRRARVGVFTGCVGDALFRHVHWATARVLQWHGCEVWTPTAQVCCGALHHHSGLEAEAASFARRNLSAFADPRLDAIIVNVAGCGSTLKDYGRLLAGETESSAGAGSSVFGRKEPSEAGTTNAAAGVFAAKVKDVHEFLVELGPRPPVRRLPLRAVYHDACHLCHAQQIRRPPRQLLQMIPGLELAPLTESEVCCGAAGSYNLTEPDMAARLGERKVEHILAARPEAVFAANAGCLLQIGRHLRRTAPNIWVAHPIEALWKCYRG